MTENETRALILSELDASGTKPSEAFVLFPLLCRIAEKIAAAQSPVTVVRQKRVSNWTDERREAAAQRMRARLAKRWANPNAEAA